MKPCNTGRPISSLCAGYRSLLDTTKLDPFWPDKKTLLNTDEYYLGSKTDDRGQRCVFELSQRPEKVVFVVSHGRFLSRSVTFCKFARADYRIFDFDVVWLREKSRKLTQDEFSKPYGGRGRSSPKESGRIMVIRYVEPAEW